MTNPFVYGKEVRGYQFYDRRESCEELHGYLKDGSTNVVLYAPRRYGKTSLVIRVLERLKTDGMDALLFDVSKVPTVEKFCEAYVSAVYAVYGGLPEIANKITRYLLHLHPTFVASVKGVSLRLDYGGRMNEQTLSDVLELPERLAAEAGRPLAVAFDEFQDIAFLSTTMRMEACFRSVIQSHQKVRYVFLGSKTHLMKRMFGTATRPFYRSAFNMKIGKPPREESAEFVASRFADAGLSLSTEALERILDVSENIPYYVQAVSGQVFAQTSGGRKAGIEVKDVEAAFLRLVDAGADFYAEIVRNLPPSQSALIEALAEEPTGRFDDSYRQRHNLPSLSTVHSAAKGLVERGLVESDARGYAVGDPVFIRYLRTTTPAQVL